MLRGKRLGGGLLILLMAVAAAALADESALTPPKEDVPYLVHAGDLVETMHHEASEQRKKNQVTYTVPGTTSTARTPLAGPEFLFLSGSTDPNALRLYAFEVRNGQREISFHEKKRKQNPEPYILSVFPVSERLYKVRADESLPRGEYCLTPEGANDAYCFTVY